MKTEAKTAVVVRGKLLKPADAAKCSGISYTQMCKYIRDGMLPFPYYQVMPGKRVFDSADIDDWLNKIKVPAGKPPGNW